MLIGNENNLKTIMIRAINALVVIISLMSVAPIADARDSAAGGRPPICGRLIISFLGAGELGHDSKGGEPPDKGIREDPHEYDAFLNFKQFLPLASSNIPSCGIFISSDQEFNTKIPQEPPPPRYIAVGIAPNTPDSFKAAFDATNQASLLSKALAVFEADQKCKETMVKLKLKSVLPLLKIEILIDSEYVGFNRLPSWPRPEMEGSIDHWFHNSEYITPEIWKESMRSLSGAVVHVFISSCKSAAIGRAFEKGASSEGVFTSFIASSSRGQEDFGGKYGSIWNQLLPNDGERLRYGVVRNYYAGNNSQVEMESVLYNRYRRVVIVDATDHAYPLPDLEKERRNVLMGFIFNSADSIALEVLELVAEKSAGYKLAQAILAADFIPELPGEALELPEVSTVADDRREILGKIATHLDFMTESYKSIIAVGANRKIDGGPQWNSIDKFIDAFNMQLNEYNALRNKLTAHESMTPLAEKYVRILGEMFFLWERMGTLVPKDGEMAEKFPDKVTKLEAVLSKYVVFRKDLDAYELERRKGRTKELAQAKREAESMTANLKTAVGSLRNQLFNVYRADAVVVKLARIRTAARLLAQHPECFPESVDTNAYLKELSEKLECLTRYPVGPKADQSGVKRGTRR